MARDRALNARRIAQSGASPRYVNPPARAGPIARGVMYAIIGWIAVQIALGHSGHPGRRGGPLAARCRFTGPALGPWLPAMVALGPVTSGVYSIAEARWL